MKSHDVLIYHRTLAAILALIGLNAVAAGFGFMGTPDGSALGIPEAWLADSPFKDYMIPGVILFALGVLHLFAAYLQARRGRLASQISEIAGLSLVIWIVVQAAMMGIFRHPTQTILQAVCMALGLVTVFLSSRQMSFRRQARIRTQHPQGAK
jgi:hypothetical protein